MRIISIVSHGHSLFVVSLIKSLERYFKVVDNDIKIVIVNNLPEDEIMIESEYFQIEIIKNSIPKGFGENHNFVFEAYNPDVFYIINPDIIFFETIEESSILPTIPEYGLCAPEIVSKEKKTLDYKRKPLTLINLFRRHLGIKEKGTFSWFSGMFIVCNQLTFRKLGGFDPKYFMYVEDCDLSYRLVQSGGKLQDIKKMRVIHDERRMSLKSFRHFLWHVKSIILYRFTKSRTINFK